MKQIDIVDIRKAVKDKQIVFYVKNGIIYCRWYEDNGECMQVGEVNGCDYWCEDGYCRRSEVEV